jgi:hypothetical protein
MALSIKRPERTVTVCLDGSLVAEYERENAKLEDAQKRVLLDERMVDPTKGLAQKVIGLHEQARKSSVDFVIRGLKRGDWQKFVDAHPARKDNEQDDTYGFNTETLFDAVLSSEDPASIVAVTKTETGEAEEFAPTDWAAFADDLTNNQYMQFQLAVLAVNNGKNDVPFSRAAFRETRRSDES